MKSRPLLLVGAAVLAGALGLAASVALHGTGPLRASPLGGWIASLLDDPGRAVLRTGDRVEPWTAQTLAGGEIRLPVDGRPTLVNYWASWCAPCREELPLLIDEARARGDRLALAAIALDDAEPARRFADAIGIPGPVPVEAPGPEDSSVRLGNRTGVLPFSALVGADGRLRAIRVGAFRSRADLQGWLEQAETRR